MSIVSYRRPDKMSDDVYEKLIDGLKRADSTPTKDCPNLVAEYEKRTKKNRKLIVASEDDGSNSDD